MTKKKLFISILLFVNFLSYSQVWTWVGGNQQTYQPNNYGVKGVAAPTNSIGTRSDAATWEDKNGNLWLFGGQKYNPLGTCYLNDLWKYDINNNTWTWVAGDTLDNTDGVYGANGVPSASYYPGSTYNCVDWVDKNGNFWMYGGYGSDAVGMGFNSKEDLWRYNPTTYEWTWFGRFYGAAGYSVFGTKGVPSPSNTPGQKDEASSMVDTAGNLWLFGGYSLGPFITYGASNTLWKYSTSSNQWTWVSGSTQINQNGIYGTIGVPSTTTMPGSRTNAATWVDANNNIWIFGGYGYGLTKLGPLNDLWKYNITTNEWIWVGGANEPKQVGNYGTKGVESITNEPPCVSEPICWSDKSNNFWMLGGEAFTDTSSYIYNSLWKFNNNTQNWTWMGGIPYNNAYAIYGTKGVADPLNAPGSNSRAMSWVDMQGKLWMFGGVGLANSGTFGYINDWWVFDTGLVPTAINENKLIQSATIIFPNPNNGVFSIKLPEQIFEINNLIIKVYNMLGQQVYTEKTNNQLITINLNKPNAGMYLVKIFNNEDEIYTSKVIVE